MEKGIKYELMQGLFRFRKNGLEYVKIADLNMTELFVMKNLFLNLFNGTKRVDLAEIQSQTYITKAAISKMFTSLEKKGYLVRETDKSNRRKITVEITPCGKHVVEGAAKKADDVLNIVISRLGMKETCQLISLLNQFSDVVEEVRNELGS